MAQEEFDARMDAGEDPYAIVADDFKRRGYIYSTEHDRWLSPDRQQIFRLAGLLQEAINWARRPSPIPIEPFREFLAAANGELARVGKEPSR